MAQHKGLDTPNHPRQRSSRTTSLSRRLLSAFLFTTTITTPFGVHAYTPLSTCSLQHIPSAPPSDFDIHPESNSLLAPILIPRVPGTEGSRLVQNHFVDFFSTQLPDWTLEWQNSTSTTPVTGDQQIPFANLILRRDPPWVKGDAKKEGNVKRLTLAAHYDSLYRPEGFIGAVDSAAPCAVLMAVARGVDSGLTKRWEGAMTRRKEMVDSSGLEEEEEEEDEDIKGVQIVLFDGEEAWERWTSTDSTYGSRALAEAWESSPYEASSTHSNRLESISLLVLLDLLGASNPRIPSYFWDTHGAYGNLAKIEDRLRNLGLLETAPASPFLPDRKKPYNRFTRGYIQDDHVPFMERGVKVLHVIPTPFPPVWHTMMDDGQHLDLPTVRDWAKIMTAFVAEWMDLDGVLAQGSCDVEEKKGSEGGMEKDEL
ncbi:hypothetical protein SMAC4_02942 [Sordaria macrospora]|uniref:uncharacterized protein n=1 Tax=Sordaria macrospora TaxID=5147 RepID=UPI001E005D82|nr:peptidase family M28-domain-containing protein [Sordaria sp. MPI-SDFR-AT-0083]WPJ58303.1 hypothetical protein SMAC4_02942 [Sordaria macrospora]